jgi:hypothetical protein
MRKKKGTERKWRTVKGWKGTEEKNTSLLA